MSKKNAKIFNIELRNDAKMLQDVGILHHHNKEKQISEWFEQANGLNLEIFLNVCGCRSSRLAEVTREELLVLM